MEAIGNVVDVLSRGVTPAPRELRLRRVFATCVIALACVLLVSLALVGRSLRNVLNVNPGFEPRGVLTFSVGLPAANYPTPERMASFYAALLGALHGRLGAGTVSVIKALPLTHDRGRRFMRLRPDEPTREAVLREAGPAYFDVMRILIVAGRAFDTRDNAEAPPRVVVSQSLAERWFAGEPAIGRQIRLGPGPRAPVADVIGVAGNVKHRALDEEGAGPTVYRPVLQTPSGSMLLVVRSQRPEADVIATVQEEKARRHTEATDDQRTESPLLMRLHATVDPDLNRPRIKTVVVVMATAVLAAIADVCDESLSCRAGLRPQENATPRIPGAHVAWY